MSGAASALGATHAQAARFAQALTMLGASPPLAVAVSGGADSLALLLLARAVAPGAVIAATVDHGLRPEAAAEARRVARLCDRLGVAHRTLAVSVGSAGGPQAAARAARYAALGAWAIAGGAATLATAHHLDDQAETLLLRLARGAGLGGLAGVRAARALAPGLRLVRPLLGWRRAELAAIVAAARLTPVDDPSNADPRYDRTRVRALLAGGWPEAPRLAACAAHLAQAEEALAWATAREAAARLRRGEGEATLDPADLPDEIVRRLVAQALRHVADEGELPGPELGRLIARLRAGEAATLGRVKALPGGCWRFEPAPPHRAT